MKIRSAHLILESSQNNLPHSGQENKPPLAQLEIQKKKKITHELSIDIKKIKHPSFLDLSLGIPLRHG